MAESDRSTTERTLSRALPGRQRSLSWFTGMTVFIRWRLSTRRSCRWDWWFGWVRRRVRWILWVGRGRWVRCLAPRIIGVRWSRRFGWIRRLGRIVRWIVISHCFVRLVSEMSRRCRRPVVFSLCLMGHHFVSPFLRAKARLEFKGPLKKAGTDDSELRVFLTANNADVRSNRKDAVRIHG